YEFHREDAFDARPFGLAPTQAKPFLRFNQYGGNIGGPIPLPHFKKKLFFFFNYEGTRGLTPGNTQFNSQQIAGLGRGYTLPDPKWLTGDFTSAYSSGTLGTTNFQNGQIFVPGTVTYTNGQISGGVPICGTVASPCNIVPQSMFSKNAAAWVNYWKSAY